MKMIKSFKDSSLLLLLGITKTIQNEVKEQKGGFLSMFSGKYVSRKRINRAGYKTVATR